MTREQLFRHLQTRTVFDVAKPCELEEIRTEETKACLGCGRPYRLKDVELVKSFGPLCKNCVQDVVNWVFRLPFPASAGGLLQVPEGVAVEVPESFYTHAQSQNAFVLHELKSRVRKNVRSMVGKEAKGGTLHSHDGSTETFLFLKAGPHKVAWFRSSEKDGGIIARVYSPAGPKDGTWDMDRHQPDYNGGQEFLCTSLSEWQQFHRGVYGALAEWKP